TLTPSTRRMAAPVLDAPRGRNAVGLMPGPQAFEGGAGSKDIGVGESAADDLHADGQLVRRKAGRHRGRGMAGEVDRVGEAPADQAVDRLAIDIARTMVLPSAALSTGRQASVGVTSRSYLSSTLRMAS